MASQDDVVSGLRILGIRASVEALHALIKQVTKTRSSAVECFENLVALERREREARNLEARTKAATIGAFKPLDRFDWNHPRSIDRALYEELHGLDFLSRADNVLFRGQSGVGKTNLAQALAHAALLKGHTVRFTTLAAVIADLSRQESVPALERRLRRYTHVSLLVIDELGYLPCDSRSADLLYTVISRRHEQRSTAISTNLSYKQWGSVFPGAACVAALIDRFAQHCQVIDIDADSWRNKEATERAACKKPKA